MLTGCGTAIGFLLNVKPLGRLSSLPLLGDRLTIPEERFLHGLLPRNEAPRLCGLILLDLLFLVGEGSFFVADFLDRPRKERESSEDDGDRGLDNPLDDLLAKDRLSRRLLLEDRSSFRLFPFSILRLMLAGVGSAGGKDSFLEFPSELTDLARDLDCCFFRLASLGLSSSVSKDKSTNSDRDPFDFCPVNFGLGEAN